MDKNKITNLAKSLSSSCKQAVKDAKLIEKLASPAAILVTVTVMEVIAEDPSKSKIWIGV